MNVFFLKLPVGFHLVIAHSFSVSVRIQNQTNFFTVSFAKFLCNLLHNQLKEKKSNKIE